LEELQEEQENERGAGGGQPKRRPRSPSPSSRKNPLLLPFDAVLSDMLHFTSGSGDVDVARSLELAGTALHAAVGYHYDEAERQGGPDAARAVAEATGVPRHSGLLRPGGNFVVKVYEGSGVDDWLRDCRGYFDKVVRLRVAASRSMSREFYAVGLGRKALVRGKSAPLACDLPLLLDDGRDAVSGSVPGLPGSAEGQQMDRAGPKAGAAAQQRVRRRPGEGVGGGGGGGTGKRAPRRPSVAAPPAEAPPSEW
jgi:23S rRNA U2552 (ribose-2'-O)-methylase RlmE/FtsJ